MQRRTHITRQNQKWLNVHSHICQNERWNINEYDQHQPQEQMWADMVRCEWHLFFVRYSRLVRAGVSIILSLILFCYPLLDTFPFSIQDTIRSRIPMGSIISYHIMAYDALELCAYFFDDFSRAYDTLIRFRSSR